MRLNPHGVLLNLPIRERARWYPNGSKVVPADLVLTAETLAHWYCGDGYRSNKGYVAAFATDGFSVHDVGLLIHKLQLTFGFRLTMMRSEIAFI